MCSTIYETALVEVPCLFLSTLPDSCNGALIQYFADQKCTNYLGSSTFDASVNTCAVSKDPMMEPNEYQKIQCTTSPSPPFPTQTLAGE